MTLQKIYNIDKFEFIGVQKMENKINRHIRERASLHIKTDDLEELMPYFKKFFLKKISFSEKRIFEADIARSIVTSMATDEGKDDAWKIMDKQYQRVVNPGNTIVLIRKGYISVYGAAVDHPFGISDSHPTYITKTFGKTAFSFNSFDSLSVLGSVPEVDRYFFLFSGKDTTDVEPFCTEIGKPEIAKKILSKGDNDVVLNFFEELGIDPDLTEEDCLERGYIPVKRLKYYSIFKAE